MDDFLHNLRSGKLKHADRGRRDYNDYKGPQRRVSNDRRKTDYYAKVTNENFAMIKETLDALLDSQKRIALAMEERQKTQVRIAGALETIAKMVGRHVDVEDVTPQHTGMQTVDQEKSLTESRSIAGYSGGRTDGEGAGAQGSPDLIDIISTMRDQGDSWEKIARYFDERKIPTVSGKGKWRGPAIKKYWETNA